MSSSFILSHKMDIHISNNYISLSGPTDLCSRSPIKVLPVGVPCQPRLPLIRCLESDQRWISLLLTIQPSMLNTLFQRFKIDRDPLPITLTNYRLPCILLKHVGSFHQCGVNMTPPFLSITCNGYHSNQRLILPLSETRIDG
jgi:hypothetical protein